MDEARYQMYKNASYVTGYYDEFSKRLDNIVTAESNLRLANETIDGIDVNNIEIDTIENKINLEEIELLGTITTQKVINTRIVADMELLKIDEDTKDPLKNIEFKVNSNEEEIILYLDGKLAGLGI
mgnify:CR=1 FL=1